MYHLSSAWLDQHKGEALVRHMHCHSSEMMRSLLQAALQLIMLDNNMPLRKWCDAGC